MSKDNITPENAEQIIKFLGLKPKESILMLYDNTTKGIIKPAYDLISGKNDAITINVDDPNNFKRPFSQVPESIKNLAKGKDVCFYALEKRADEKANELYFRRKLNKIVEDSGGRVGNMLSLTPKIVREVFINDANKINELTERLFDYMHDVKDIKVTAPGGTDVVVNFNPLAKNIPLSERVDDTQYKWLKTTGFIGKGKRNVMPAEVYTHPADVNGKIVVDGTYGYLGSLSQFKNNQETLERLMKNPIIWDVKDGIIEDVKCGDEKVYEAVISQVFETENGQYIGECGMGTNIIDMLTGIIFIDEKSNIHFAHGHGYPEETGAPLRSPKGPHYDGCIRTPTIINLNNKQAIMESGKYNILV